MFALTVAAQHTSDPAGSGVPTTEDQLKVLIVKLDLTADQQAKIKPILAELHDASVKLVQDENMSRDERLSHVRPSRYEADKKIREVLNDEQKKKLDQMEKGPAPGTAWQSERRKVTAALRVSAIVWCGESRHESCGSSASPGSCHSYKSI